MGASSVIEKQLTESTPNYRKWDYLRQLKGARSLVRWFEKIFSVVFLAIKPKADFFRIQ